MPYADGGEASVSNIQLRCRTHNQYEAERWSGDLWPSHVRENSRVSAHDTNSVQTELTLTPSSYG